MEVYTLSLEEQAKTGFTHKAVIDYTDLVSVGGASTSAVFDLIPYTAGYLFQAAAYKLVTAFDGGDTTNLTLDVGWNGASTDDDDGLLNGYEIHVDATEVLYGDGNGAAFATLRTGYAALDAGDIEATFTATGANCNVLTAGEIHIYLKAVNLAKF
jgi:hypothetical protein